MDNNDCPQVTLVFTRSEQLNTNFNPDTSLVGVRIPDHAFLRQVCRYSTVQYSTKQYSVQCMTSAMCRLCGGPLALTSANLSNETSSLRVEEFSSLHSRYS